MITKTLVRFSMIVACFLGGSAALRAQCVLPEEQKLIMPGLGFFAFAGKAVAMDGDLLAIGAPFHQNNGGVFIFEKQGASWAHVQTLFASDGHHGAEFGQSLALQGNALLVGAHMDAGQVTGGGAAYVFRLQGNQFVEEQKLIPSDPTLDKNFGVSVALSSGELVIGAIRDNQRAVDAGAAYVFSDNGTQWVQDQKLTASDAAFETQFGASVALEANELLVSGFQRDSSGSVYAFERRPAGWVEDQIVRASDAAFGALFGSSVALSHSWMIVGAELEDEGGSEAGAAYFFEKTGSTWTERQKVLASDASPTDFFGKSVDIEGDVAVIGAWGNSSYGHSSGATFQFRRQGSIWLEQQKLLPSNGASGHFFGSAVGISGEDLVAGAYFVFPGGAAYTFPVKDLALTVNPDSATVGDLVQFRTCGGLPGSPLVWFVSASDGTPFFLRVPVLNFFGGDGRVTNTFRIDQLPPIPPATIEFTAFSLDGNGRLLRSNQEILGIH